MSDRLKNYYRELPPDFSEDRVIDAREMKTAVILNCAALVLLVAVVVICFFIKFDGFPFNASENAAEYLTEYFIVLVTFLAVLIAYVVAHELTHGITYKALTGQRLRFGITLSVAYCGLKEGYVNKKTAIIACLSPFVIHSIWMIAVICVLPADVWALMLIAVFGLHFGGCCGDLFVVMLLIMKYRGREVLMKDDGPCQRFYVNNKDRGVI